MNISVDLVVRSLNEAYWIRRMAEAIRRQSSVQIIPVLVDSGSSDGSAEIFSQEFPHGKVIAYPSERYRPGKALNLGIDLGNADYILILSAHCVPLRNDWALQLLGPLLRDPQVSGAYGRQLPSKSSRPSDIRDLFTVFSSEDVLHTKSPFFHNANSVIRRDVWRRRTFSETLTNIEDRHWADACLAEGEKIAYCANAAVIHHHGIFHHENVGRASAISDYLLKMHEADYLSDLYPSGGFNRFLLIVVLGLESASDCDRLYELEKSLGNAYNLLIYTRKRGGGDLALKDNTIINLFDNPLEEGFVDAIKTAIMDARRKGFFPDCVLYINYPHLLEDLTYYTKLVDHFYDTHRDSVFFGRLDDHAMFVEESTGFVGYCINYVPASKRPRSYAARFGSGTVTRIDFPLAGKLIGSDIDILDLDA